MPLFFLSHIIKALVFVSNHIIEKIGENGKEGISRFNGFANFCCAM